MSKNAKPKAATPVPGSRIWERFEGETEKQYAAFCSFKNIPPIDRTALEAYRRYTGKNDAPNAHSWWYEMSQRNRWRERVAAYDQHIERIADEKEADERVRARQLRRAVLVLGNQKAVELLRNVDSEKASVGDIVRLMEVSTRGLRDEYAEGPEQKTMMTVVDGGQSDMVKLAARASVLTDTEAVSEYRRLTNTLHKAVSDGMADEDGEQEQGEDKDAGEPAYGHTDEEEQFG